MHERNFLYADAGVEANARLTGSIALALLVLLTVEWVTGLTVRQTLVAHALVGFLLIPPVALKLGSVGYRDAYPRAGRQPAARVRRAAPAGHAGSPAPALRAASAPVR